METSQQQLSKAEHSVVSSGTTTSEDRTQEQVLKAKYGGLLPKKKLMPRDQKYFDSADWQMGKQHGEGGAAGLRPKLQPSQPPPRRNSQLGDNR